MIESQYEMSLQPESRQMSFAQSNYFLCPIVLQLCTEHPPVLCEKLQNNLVTEVDARRTDELWVVILWRFLARIQSYSVHYARNTLVISPTHKPLFRRSHGSILLPLCSVCLMNYQFITVPALCRNAKQYLYPYTRAEQDEDELWSVLCMFRVWQYLWSV